jgi:hypothetical protein
LAAEPPPGPAPATPPQPPTGASLASPPAGTAPSGSPTPAAPATSPPAPASAATPPPPASATAEPPDFYHADTNFDARIEFDEAQKIWPQLTRKQFDAADLDGSGSLNGDEYALVVKHPPK